MSYIFLALLVGLLVQDLIQSGWVGMFPREGPSWTRPSRHR